MEHVAELCRLVAMVSVEEAMAYQKKRGRKILGFVRRGGDGGLRSGGGRSILQPTGWYME
jgi:hypothetical protein